MYIDWAKSHLKVEINKLKIFEQAVNERGFYVEDDITLEQNILISIPVDSLLNLDYCVYSHPIFISLLSVLREDDLLALLLLYERSLKQESKFYYHIIILPSEYHSITNYSDDELELIRGSNLFVLAHRWKSQIATDFEDLVSFRIQGNEVALGELFSDFFSIETYHWALSTIWSRFVTIEKSGRALRSMIPVVDLLK